MATRINQPRTRQQRRRLAAADFYRRQQKKRIQGGQPVEVILAAPTNLTVEIIE